MGEDEQVEMLEGTNLKITKLQKKSDKQLANILDTYDYEGEAADISLFISTRKFIIYIS